MSTAFPFIPRSVAKGKARDSPNKTRSSNFSGPLPPGQGACSLQPAYSGTHVEQSKQDEKARDSSLIILIEMALSDYAFWCNPDIQRRMKAGHGDGFLPVRYLLAESSVLSSLHPLPSEADVMRCIRSSPGSCLETRMMISEPSRSEWFNREKTSSNTGGFEVRRKNWDVLLETLSEGDWNKEWWDQRTIYIERLPAAYRSIDTVARFIHSLLAQTNPVGPSKTPVQAITFPSHHLASVDERPRCRGFAFVVFDSPTLVEALCQLYPWDGASPVVKVVDQEVTKFGLRVTTKKSWVRLKLEYLGHQRHLLSQAAQVETPESSFLRGDLQGRGLSPKLGCDLSASTLSSKEMQTQPSFYPHNCLIFVRNIRPDTNKTTLRALFNTALTSKDIIDYVDFGKGIDTCHIRLASPSAAIHLVSHFAAHPTSQHDALDQIGSAPAGDRPKMEFEIVKGKREELYWEKVPEKVRNTAVARLHRSACDGVQSLKEDLQNPGRKRRRKG